ncbi:hypothetical protein [uncultured Duncaniella sp.]|uniref:hypothetical protein n=1 Tax=uncultured Duncaniella sp. TaxID=2768039 RepID=UPI002606B33B|nr:hypothetical protein [uncultured Duncaniella sp.]
MSEVELLLINGSEQCTVYTIHFLADEESEFEKFVIKFKEDAEFNPDFQAIMRFVEQILSNGALERYFRPEGKISDSVVALPVIRSKLRLYCLRLSDKILVLGNGDVKTTRSYQESDTLQGYVMTLQKFERLLKQESRLGNVKITEKEIKTDNTFEI